MVEQTSSLFAEHSRKLIMEAESPLHSWEMGYCPSIGLHPKDLGQKMHQVQVSDKFWPYVVIKLS